jgi:quercetin 2,3-dioxygenase
MDRQGKPHPARVAAWVAAALLAGPAATVAVWAVAGAKQGFVVEAQNAPRYSGQQGREADITEILATAQQTGGALGLFRQSIAPGNGPPDHIHHNEDEFFYVLSGEFSLKVGDRIVTAGPDSLMFVPRGTVHTFRNVGKETGSFLVGVTPGGFEKLFMERPGLDAKAYRELSKAHGMEVVAPPK